jgi:hypothetical protein
MLANKMILVKTSVDEMSFLRLVFWRHDTQHKNNHQKKNQNNDNQHDKKHDTIMTYVMLCFLNFYAECRYAECHYAECRYAECHYAECRGALLFVRLSMLTDMTD